MRLGGEAVGVFGQLKPAIDGTRVDADDASDILYTVARLDGLNGLASSLFQSAGRSIRSAQSKGNKFAVGRIVIGCDRQTDQGVQVTLIARNPSLADNDSSMETKNDGKFQFHSLTKGDYGLIVNLSEDNRRTGQGWTTRF